MMLWMDFAARQAAQDNERRPSALWAAVRAACLLCAYLLRRLFR